ncbi:MAG: hypothetical protein ACRYHA_16380, partial [Janthinobacterium lividum]
AGHPGLSHRKVARLADVDPFDALLDRDWARVLINDSPMSILMPDVDHFALLLAHDQPILDPEEASRRHVQQEAERAVRDAERAAAFKATQDALWAVEREAVRRARQEQQDAETAAGPDDPDAAPRKAGPKDGGQGTDDTPGEADDAGDRPAGKFGDELNAGPLSLRAQASFFSFGTSRWHSPIRKPTDE